MSPQPVQTHAQARPPDWRYGPGPAPTEITTDAARCAGWPKVCCEWPHCPCVREGDVTGRPITHHDAGDEQP